MSYMLFDNFSSSNIFNFPVMYDDKFEFNINADEFLPGMNVVDYESTWWSMNKDMFMEKNIIYIGNIEIDVDNKKSNECVMMPKK